MSKIIYNESEFFDRISDKEFDNLYKYCMTKHDDKIDGAFKDAVDYFGRESAKSLANKAEILEQWMGFLPSGKLEYKFNPLNGTKGFILTKKEPGCDHQWINVGFHFDKMVCKKCDCDKK